MRNERFVPFWKMNVNPITLFKDDSKSTQVNIQLRKESIKYKMKN